MPDHTDAPDLGPPPEATLLPLMTGYWVAQAIAEFARLGLADLLADGPASARDLATRSDSHPQSLHRLLRALASIGVLAEPTPGAYALTPVTALLRSGTPDSMRSLAMAYGNELFQAWNDFSFSVQTGKPAFAHHFGMDPFAFYAANPEADRIFNEAMIGYTHRVAEALVAAYDFAGIGTLADIGGGYGTILATVLQRHPAMRGVLFDMPHVVEAARPLLQDQGVGDRCETIGGDFFAAIPAGMDAYLLSQILHDWDEAQCRIILRHCREAIPAHGKLLLVEMVLPDSNEPSFGQWLDLHMLAITGGQERTASEYTDLLRSEGFTVTGIIPTAAGPGVVEATPT